MSEEIIGVDEPAGSSRPPWWVFVIGAVVVAALIAIAIDALVKTDTERAAEATAGLFNAFADGDGERACALLTEESQAEELKVVKLTKPSVSTCPEAIEADLAGAQSLGGVPEDAGKIESDDIENSIEIDGEAATVVAGSGLTDFTLNLRKVDGEWLVDLGGAGATPALPDDASPSATDLIAAADKICLTAYPRSSSAISDLLAAARNHDIEGMGTAASAWAASEQGLADDLETLAPEGSGPIDALRAALAQEVAVIQGISDEPQSLAASFGAIRRESANVTAVAAEQGFAEFGCAAPANDG